MQAHWIRLVQCVQCKTLSFFFSATLLASYQSNWIFWSVWEVKHQPSTKIMLTVLLPFFQLRQSVLCDYKNKKWKSCEWSPTVLSKKIKLSFVSTALWERLCSLPCSPPSSSEHTNTRLLSTCNPSTTQSTFVKLVVPGTFPKLTQPHYLLCVPHHHRNRYGIRSIITVSEHTAPRTCFLCKATSV